MNRFLQTGSILVFVLASYAAFAQPADTAQVEETVLEYVEDMPEFPGGQKAMFDFIRRNMRYPESARKDSVQGKVFIEFVIEREGSVSHVKIIKGVRTDLDQEAIRVISMMPQWKPGKQGGKPCRVKFRLPIYFKLD